MESFDKQLSKVAYTIKFGHLPAKQIYNLNGPEFKDGTPTLQWDLKAIEERRIFAENYINKYNRIAKNFYNKLAQSLRETGCQDPVIISVGNVKSRFLKHLPTELQQNTEHIIACIGPGCSRLWWFQQWDWQEIPCIALDYVNMFPDWEIIDTEEKLMNKWTNKPKGFRLGHFEIGIRGNVYFEQEIG